MKTVVTFLLIGIYAGCWFISLAMFICDIRYVPTNFTINGVVGHPQSQWTPLNYIEMFILSSPALILFVVSPFVKQTTEKQEGKLRQKTRYYTMGNPGGYDDYPDFGI